MRLLFAGTPEVAVHSLDALIDAGFTIVGVLTRKDAPQGRKRVLTASPVAQRAEHLGIPVLKANRLTETVTEWATSLNPDLGVVVAYGGLLRRELLDTPKLGWINLHFSLLPAWRGAAPVQRALMNGETNLGMSVFRLVEALDAGDIIVSSNTEVQQGTTAGEALNILAQAGGQLLTEAVSVLGTDPAAGTPQSGDSTYAHKLTREDGKLDPSMSTASFIAHWAGVTPEPGAYMEVEGETLKVHGVVPVSAPSESGDVDINAINNLLPGHAAIISKRPVLATADGAVELLRVQPSGKNVMEGAAWLRGRGGKAELS